MPTNQPLLDRAAALERVGDDDELLREVAQLFLDMYPDLHAKLRSAVAQRDAVAIESLAHNIKGSVSNFGAEPVVQAAFALEQAGRARQLDQIDAQFATFDQMLSAVDAEMRRWLA